MPSFKTTKAMRDAAKLGLELRRKFGRGGLTTREAGKQGIGSGVARATAIASGKDLPIETIRRMRGYFAWLLWGGDPGKRFADRIVEAYDRER